MASSPNSPHEHDIVEEATARAEKRNEGGRHTTPKGEAAVLSVCQRRRRRRQRTTTKKRKTTKLNLDLFNDTSHQKKKQGTARTLASSPSSAASASRRPRSPTRGPRPRSGRWGPRGPRCLRWPAKKKKLEPLPLLEPPSRSAPRRASLAPCSSRERSLWTRNDEEIKKLF